MRVVVRLRFFVRGVHNRYDPHDRLRPPPQVLTRCAIFDHLHAPESVVSENLGLNLPQSDHSLVTEFVHLPITDQHLHGGLRN